MKNELIHGDALTVLPTLPAASFDALITDPPYASGGVHASSRQQSPQAKYMQSGTPQLHADFVGDERDQRSHLAWMRLWLAECGRVLKDGAPVLLFTARSWAGSGTRPSTWCGAARATCRSGAAPRCCPA